MDIAEARTSSNGNERHNQLHEDELAKKKRDLITIYIAIITLVTGSIIGLLQLLKEDDPRVVQHISIHSTSESTEASAPKTAPATVSAAASPPVASASPASPADDRKPLAETPSISWEEETSLPDDRPTVPTDERPDARGIGPTATAAPQSLDSPPVIREDRPPPPYHVASALPTQRDRQRCVWRVKSHYGVADGIVDDALLTGGNQSCVIATYGDMMSLTIETCGGESVPVQHIEVVREAFREDGRKITHPANIAYVLTIQGRETASRQLGTGGYSSVQRASFPTVLASKVRIELRSPRTRGYPVYQRLCSIAIR